MLKQMQVGRRQGQVGPCLPHNCLFAKARRVTRSFAIEDSLHFMQLFNIDIYIFQHHFFCTIDQLNKSTVLEPFSAAVCQ